MVMQFDNVDLNSSIATTQSPGDNSTKLATTAYIDTGFVGSDITFSGKDLFTHSSSAPFGDPADSAIYIKSTNPQFSIRDSSGTQGLQIAATAFGITYFSSCSEATGADGSIMVMDSATGALNVGIGEESPDVLVDLHIGDRGVGFNNDSGLWWVYTGTSVMTKLLSLDSSNVMQAIGPWTFNGAVNVDGLTASKPVFTDGSKNLVSIGTMPVDQGGTGQTTYTNGQLLIGNTTGNTLAKATLSEGEGIDITNGTGTITIAGEDASTTNKGISELATNAETNTGTDTARTLTPSNLGQWAGTTNITTLGTIGSGTWQGTVIDGTYINYNTTNLKVSSSKLNTIQDIATTSSVVFGELELQSGRLHVTGNTSPTSGTGVEIGHDGTDGVLVSYDRSLSAYKKMRYNCLSHEFEVSGTDAMILDSAGDLYLEGTDNRLIFAGTPGGAGGGISYLDSGSGYRTALMFYATDIVALSNRASNGVVQVRANTSTAGGGGEVTSAVFEDDEIQLLPNGGNVGIGTTSPATVFHTYENNSFTGGSGGVTIEQDGAGDVILNFLLTGGTRYQMGIDNSDSDSWVESYSTSLGFPTHRKVTTSGEQTLPLQPCFSAVRSGAVNNITGDGTNYTMIFNDEKFDQSGDYSTSTGIFTAPVTGRYAFSSSIYILGLSSSHTSATITLVTSNRSYIMDYFNPYNKGVVSGAQCTLNGSVAAVDLDAADTAYIRINVANGSKTVDINSGNSVHFSGALIA